MRLVERVSGPDVEFAFSFRSLRYGWLLLSSAPDPLLSHALIASDGEEVSEESRFG